MCAAPPPDADLSTYCPAIYQTFGNKCMAGSNPIQYDGPCKKKAPKDTPVCALVPTPCPRPRPGSPPCRPARVTFSNARKAQGFEIVSQGPCDDKRFNPRPTRFIKEELDLKRACSMKWKPVCARTSTSKYRPVYKTYNNACQAQGFLIIDFTAGCEQSRKLQKILQKLQP